MFIYAARNTVNGKLYVGMTTMSVAARWTAHVCAANGGAKTALHRAIRKNGREAFVVEEIAHLMPGLPLSDLCKLERELIAQERCMVPNGYNMTAGGEGTSGLPMSDERRANLSAELKAGRAKEMRAKSNGESEEARRRRSERMTGQAKSAEAVANFTAARRAAMADPVRREAMVTKMLASRTPETRDAARKLRIEMNKSLNTPERMVEMQAKRRATMIAKGYWAQEGTMH